MTSTGSAILNFPLYIEQNTNNQRDFALGNIVHALSAYS